MGAGEKITAIFGSVVRTTVKFFKNLPSRAENYVKRKISEYKRKPKRDTANKVYVLVGYATKSHIDSKLSAERNHQQGTSDHYLFPYSVYLYQCDPSTY